MTAPNTINTIERLRQSAIALSFALIQGLIFTPQSDAEVTRPLPIDTNWTATSHEHRHYMDNGQVTCQAATPQQALALDQLGPQPQLHVITAQPSAHSAKGLKIVLRGTPQLENFPEAKSAFIQAAQIWESLIASPITVVIDVDFGPTRFGTPYPNPRILGSARSQTLAGDIYPDIRNALFADASSETERSLYAALPETQIPTDLGPTTRAGGPSALLRVLDIIPRMAVPEQEFEAFGAPPNIGFNSAFTFDFNREDGIDVDKTDFIGLALHEIGHVLGFSSYNGFEEVIEQQPNETPVLTIWDLFRFRPEPGASPEFTTDSRSLMSGGEQIFFADGPELLLSTGGFTGERGDGRQSSHWKDDDLSGFYLGIMDPTLPRGRMLNITDSDLMALDAMGYTIQTTQTQP